MDVFLITDRSRPGALYEERRRRGARARTEQTERFLFTSREADWLAWSKGSPRAAIDLAFLNAAHGTGAGLR